MAPSSRAILDAPSATVANVCAEDDRPIAIPSCPIASDPDPIAIASLPLAAAFTAVELMLTKGEANSATESVTFIIALLSWRTVTASVSLVPSPTFVIRRVNAENRPFPALPTENVSFSEASEFAPIATLLFA
ncbi:MAG: hypothetical protein ABJM58_02230 [Alteripontixanthobacter sp.]